MFIIHHNFTPANLASHFIHCGHTPLHTVPHRTHIGSLLQNNYYLRITYYSVVDVLLSHTHTHTADSSSSFTESYSQDLPPRSATPDSLPQIPQATVTIKPSIPLSGEDMPDLDELPQANNVVLSDLYALTTKVHYCALDIPSSQDLSRKQTTFVDGVGGGGGGEGAEETLCT